MKYFSTFPIIILALISLVLGINACNEQNIISPDENIISGTVTDEQGIGVPNALIELVSYPGVIKQEKKVQTETIITYSITNEDGFFELKNVPQDLTGLFFRVKHKDFKYFEDEIKNVLKNQDKKKVPIRILCNDSCCGRVEISISKKSDSNSVIKDVEIRIKRNGDLVKKAFSNSEGKLILERVCPGEYEIRLFKSGYKVVEEDFTIKECDTIIFAFNMEESEQNDDTCCNGMIVIKYKNNDGQVLGGVKTRLWKDGSKLREELSNDEGYVFFREICKGNYGISFYKQGYKEQEFKVEVGCNDTVEISKVLQVQEEDTCCNGIIKVYPRDVSNNPINGIYIKLYKDGKVLKEAKVENGYAFFKDICTGKYQIDIKTDLYKPLEFSVELDCNDTLLLEKTLQKKDTDSCCRGKIILYLKDTTTNVALKNVEVKLYKGSTKVGLKTSDENGKVVFENLCKSNYKIITNFSSYFGREINVEVDCNETKELEIKLIKKQSSDTCCTAKIKIKVVDSAELPIENATVKLYTGGDIKKTLTTNSEGYIIFENLCVPPYLYAVEVLKDGYKSQEYAIEFVECSTIMKTIILKQ